MISLHVILSSHTTDMQNMYIKANLPVKRTKNRVRVLLKYVAFACLLVVDVRTTHLRFQCEAYAPFTRKLSRQSCHEACH